MPHVPTVLVADDDPAVLTTLVDLLRDDRYQVITAQNGVEALAYAQTAQVDCVLTDVMMPLMGGVALCRALAENPATRHIPIILMSAGVRREAATLCPAAAFLAKPFTVDALLDLVARVIGLASPAERGINA
jgi:CheY-like chemotaxis protein